MRRILLSALLALVIGLPVGWLATFMSTPLLWKLEPVLHMELAGHSGPSDWVFLVAWAILLPALFAAFWKALPKSSARGSAITSRL